MGMAPISFMELLILLLTSGGGGGNQLLDYVSSEAYWKLKAVPMTAPAMREELARRDDAPVDVSRQIQNLASADSRVRDNAARDILAAGPGAAAPLRQAAQSGDAEVAARARAILEQLGARGKAAAVRRLLAIRTLGELKDPTALDLLRPLVRSQAAFEAEYAAAAVAAIEGQAYERPKADPKLRERDLWLLPADRAGVAQIALPPGGPVDVRTLLEEGLKRMARGPAAPASAEQVDQAIGELTKALVEAAERVGNVRLDAVTLGLAEQPKRGGLVAILRGQYDRDAVAAALRTLRRSGGVPDERRDVQGIPVVELDPGDVAVMLPDDQTLVVLIEGMLFDEMAGAIQAGKGKLDGNQALAALIQGADRTKAAWAVLRMNDHFRGPAWTRAIETVTATLDSKGPNVALRVEAKGSEAAAVQAAVDELTGEVAQARESIAQARRRGAPVPDAVVEFLEKIEIKAGGDTATLTSEMRGGLGVLVAPLLGFRAHAVPVPVPAPVEQAR